MAEIVKHVNDTNASYRSLGAGDAKNTDLFFDQIHYAFFGGENRTIRVRLNKINLTQAVLFIASILPRKYDLGTKHKIVNFSRQFVMENLAVLDAFFTLGGYAVEERIVEWNVRKNVKQGNGKIDERLYLNGLQFDLSYKLDDKLQTTKFSIRNYLAGGYSDVHMKSNEDGVYDLFITNTTESHQEKDDILEKEETEIIFEEDLLRLPLQQIYFGAPGTGKSHEIKKLIKNYSHERTTFHPDSDYSTFAGAYKPTMKGTGVIRKIGEKQVEEERIAYEFIPQSFFKAYKTAWENYPNPEFLIIEEINRGNCAQVFGDLFQLLDRNAWGFSDYPITADEDLKRHIAEKMSLNLLEQDKDAINHIYKEEYDDICAGIKRGDLLLLPKNLYIYATMNTSDQSLFPIDSAFKRRWDWKYVPIEECVDELTDQPLKWQIVVNGKVYDWWNFLQAINEVIGSTTDSEDKKLGYFFTKAIDGKISAETFVAKVVFYLWNDVFKDYGFDDDIFQDADNKVLSFPKFFENCAGGQKVNEQRVARFIENVLATQTKITVGESSGE